MEVDQVDENLPNEEEEPKLEESIPHQFTKPTLNEVQGPTSLIGAKIAIFWDGDQVFYPCMIMNHDPVKTRFIVKYENDEGGAEYAENLRVTPWILWRGTTEEYYEYFKRTVSAIFSINLPYVGRKD
jgi:hypothetical protein